MRALITGATGFIGRHLAGRVEEPVVLSRDPQKTRRVLGEVEAHRWDPESEIPPTAAFEGVETVFHLAGESIAGIWTKKKRRHILDSRILGTQNLVRGIQACSERPRVLVCASATGYYGDRGEEVLTEESTKGEGFLSDVAAEWEANAMRAEDLGVRTVCCRSSLVLGPDGGSFSLMAIPFRLGLGGPLGGGRQYWSWVHIHDSVGMFLHGASEETLRGPVNAVAPAPIPNRIFTRALARVLRRPAFFPVPGFLMKAMLGEFSSVVLGSQRVIPERMKGTGYRFRFPALVAALHDITGKAPADPGSAGGDGWRR